MLVGQRGIARAQNRASKLAAYRLCKPNRDTPPQPGGRLLRNCVLGPFGFISATPLPSKPGIAIFFYLLFLGVVLLTIALGRPIIRHVRASESRANPSTPPCARPKQPGATGFRVPDEGELIRGKNFPVRKETKTGLRLSCAHSRHRPRSRRNYGAAVVVTLRPAPPRWHAARQLTSKRGTPLTFRVGLGQVITSLGEAFLDMKKRRAGGAVVVGGDPGLWRQRWRSATALARNLDRKSAVSRPLVLRTKNGELLDHRAVIRVASRRPVARLRSLASF